MVIDTVTVYLFCPSCGMEKEIKLTQKYVEHLIDLNKIIRYNGEYIQIQDCCLKS